MVVALGLLLLAAVLVMASRSPGGMGLARQAW